MSEYYRRTVLTTGAAFATGIGLASTATADATGSDQDPAIDVDALPDPSIDPTPEMDEDWASYRGDPGHTRDVDATYEFDGEALEAAWSVEHDGAVAIADGTVFTSSAEGVIAVDAADGTVVWTNADVDATNPAVIGDTVVVASEVGIVALDREDGRVRWERELAGDGEVSEHTVGYGGVYVVADGTLYALEIGDGSTRWARDSVTVTTPGSDEEYTFGFNRSPAAANGVVYAATQRTVHAVEPTTGEDVWRDEEVYQDFAGPIHANSKAVIVDWWSDVEQGVHDAQTGELQQLIWSETRHETTLDEEIYVSGNNHSFFASALEGDAQGWDVSSAYNAGQGVVCGDTVYVYFGDAEAEWSEYDGALVALDKHDGSERWSLTTADAPVGLIRAISDETLYVDHDGDLVALREPANEDETGEGGGDEGEEEDDGNSSEDEGGNNDGEDDSIGCSVGDEGESATDDSDEDDDEDGGVETSDVASFQADGSPGFTTGAGLLGGVLGLEWLRRRATTDESTE